MGTTESTLNYEQIYLNIESKISGIEYRLSVMEAKMYSFEQMEQQLQEMRRTALKIRHLESVESRMSKLEISLQRTLSTFLPRVEKVLQSIDNPTPGKSEAIVHMPGSSRNTQVFLTLTEAAKKGDAENIRRLLAEGADVEECDEKQETALFHAVRCRHVEAVEALLFGGADANTYNDPDEQSPLMISALNGDERISEQLITFGTDLEDEDTHGNTALWYAASAGHAHIVELLIQKGAHIDFGDPYNSPETMILEIAAKNGHADVVKTILTLDSGWSSSDLKHALSATNSPAVVWAITKIAPEDVWGDVGGWALMDAVRNNRAGAVDGLLQVGANTKHRNMNGLTALHVAASNENISAIVSLIVHGANIEAEDGKGRTPLHLAAIHKREKSVKALLAKHANRSAIDKRGRMPYDVTEDEDIRDMLRVVVT